MAKISIFGKFGQDGHFWAIMEKILEAITNNNFRCTTVRQPEIPGMIDFPKPLSEMAILDHLLLIFPSELTLEFT